MKKQLVVSLIAAFSLVIGSVVMCFKTADMGVVEAGTSLYAAEVLTTETQERESTTVADVVETTTEAPEVLERSFDWDEDDSYLLAKIAMAEAESEDIEAKALVINVVLNRVMSDKFPGTIREVIFEKKQFAPIDDGRWDRVEPNEDCWKAVEMVQYGWDESQGATYFEVAANSATWHSTHLEFLFKHQTTNYYREWGDE